MSSRLPTTNVVNEWLNPAHAGDGSEKQRDGRSGLSSPARKAGLPVLYFGVIGCCASLALEVAIRYFSSFRNTTPPFITNFTRSISLMSSSGLPETATRSANFPFSTYPICLPRS
jgi:hypothetical protein